MGVTGRCVGARTGIPAFVGAAGLRLRVGRRGAGRPLLLITGIGANLDMWAPFARLVDDRELIAFDPPGAGLSQRPRHPLRMQGLAQVVRELLDALGLERVDVLGYSFGGALAQELARRAPNRVRRLVLCATAPGLGGTPPRPLAALMLATPARYYHPVCSRSRSRISRAGAPPVRRSSYRVAVEHSAAPEAWTERAATTPGSWCPTTTTGSPRAPAS